MDFREQLVAQAAAASAAVGDGDGGAAAGLRGGVVTHSVEAGSVQVFEGSVREHEHELYYDHVNVSWAGPVQPHRPLTRLGSARRAHTSTPWDDRAWGALYRGRKRVST